MKRQEKGININMWLLWAYTVRSYLLVYSEAGLQLLHIPDDTWFTYSLPTAAPLPLEFLIIMPQFRRVGSRVNGTRTVVPGGFSSVKEF